MKTKPEGFYPGSSDAPLEVRAEQVVRAFDHTWQGVPCDTAASCLSCVTTVWGLSRSSSDLFRVHMTFHGNINLLGEEERQLLPSQGWGGDSKTTVKLPQGFPHLCTLSLLPHITVSSTCQTPRRQRGPSRHFYSLNACQIEAIRPTKKLVIPNMMSHACNPCTQEGQAGGGS